jgi:hypothetical protein
MMPLQRRAFQRHLFEAMPGILDRILAPGDMVGLMAGTERSFK